MPSLYLLRLLSIDLRSTQSGIDELAEGRARSRLSVQVLRQVARYIRTCTSGILALAAEGTNYEERLVCKEV